MKKQPASRNKYDVFISHASEDKDSFVRQFASRLSDLGVRVWYDEFTLGVGDGLSKSIDRGLRQSRYGVVIISLAFLKKTWPEYELRTMLARQISGKKVILPIWHNVDKQEIIKYSPMLADTVAINSANGVDSVALQILNIVRPEIFDALARRIRFKQSLSSLPELQIPVSQLIQSPRKRNKLTDGQMRRVRITNALLDNDIPIEDSYDAFLRDLNVEDELQIWEWIALVYHFYKSRSNCSPKVSFALYQFLVGAELQELLKIPLPQAQKADLEKLPGLDIDLLLNIIRETSQHPNLESEDNG